MSLSSLVAPRVPAIGQGGSQGGIYRHELFFPGRKRRLVRRLPARRPHKAAYSSS